MAESTEPPKIWPFQDEFVRGATQLVRHVFKRIGASVTPALAFVGIPSWKEEEYPLLVVPSEGLRWSPDTSTWLKLIEAEAKKTEDSKSLMLWATRSSYRAIAMRKVVADDLESHDQKSAKRTFISQVAQMWNYDVLAVLEFDASSLNQHASTSRPSDDGKRDVNVGLVVASAEAALERIFHELCKGRAAMRGFVEQRDVDDVLRDAGERLLRAVQWTVRDSVFGENLFERLNVLSTLPYEGAEGRGRIVFESKSEPSKRNLTFSDAIPLREAVWARKTLQMATDNSPLACDTEKLLGIGDGSAKAGRFYVRFQGQNRWQLGHGERLLAEIAFGLPALPRQRLRRERFDEAFVRVFGVEAVGSNAVWDLIEAALKQKRGTMVVVSDDAAGEATRFFGQAIRVEPTLLTSDVALRTTEIDGAVLLDTSGVCHAIGVILDGQASSKGTPSRGARFNSAVRYVNDRPGRLAVVVSEDGHVDLFPRLRPRITVTELASLHQTVADRPKDARPPPEVVAAATRLVRFYWEYTLADERKQILDCARTSFLRLGEDEDPFSEVYDEHDSDLIDDAEKDETREGK
ncbi:MAG: diadenylate cyclase [Polyangiaceae bacterium]